MPKSKSKLEIRMRALELAAGIAAEAAQNTNVVWMIEFQEELLERLYRKMMALLQDDETLAHSNRQAGEAPDDEEDVEPALPAIVKKRVLR